MDAPPEAVSSALPLKVRVYRILHGPETGGPAGRVFEVFILSLISLNVLMLVLETVQPLHQRLAGLFYTFEVVSVAVFTLEYVLRIWSCTASPRFASPVAGRIRYALTPLAVIDLLAILPFYLPTGPLDLRSLRALRLMRIFRIAKLWRYSRAMATLGRVVASRREDLLATLLMVLLLVVIASSLMYFAEHEAQPDRFSSIPAAMWWGIITVTTIGYGDVYPVTAAGRVLAAVIAVLGIGLFALPTGILGASFIEELQRRKQAARSRDPDPSHCPHCGKRIEH